MNMYATDMQCIEDSCDRSAKARGLCGMHWQRWRKTTDTVSPYGQVGCKVESCDGSHCAKGLCQKHYARWLKHGDLERVDPKIKSGPGNHQWRGGVSAYHQAHRVVNMVRGPARDFLCECCADRPGSDWAVNHAWPGVVMGTKGGHAMPYNWDPAGYLALCRSCHRKYDSSR